MDAPGKKQIIAQIDVNEYHRNTDLDWYQNF